MNRSKQFAALMLICTACPLAGCANRGGILGVDCCADVPAGAIPEPPGTKVCHWQTEQVGAAIADQTVLYRADFVGATDQLSPAAKSRLSRHAQSTLASALPWVIEPSGDDDVDNARIAATMNELTLRGVTPSDVQVAMPAALGLTGPQAERVASGFGNIRNSSAGTGAPISRASGLGGLGGGGGRGF